jgi:clathrin heavy chain
VVFKYIEAATKLDQNREVERVCRENDHYDPERVKSFLLEVNMKDPRPLIYVCDRHGYVEELTNYLFSKNMYPFIEAYVQKMNPSATPKVVGALLDLNAQEDQIRDLFTNVRPPQCPVKELVEEVEKRNRCDDLRFSHCQCFSGAGLVCRSDHFFERSVSLRTLPH